eukprot:4350597-Prymnesium_polylepis.1
MTAAAIRRVAAARAAAALALARRTARRAVEPRLLHLPPRPPRQHRSPCTLVLAASLHSPADSNGQSNGRSRRHRQPL